MGRLASMACAPVRFFGSLINATDPNSSLRAAFLLTVITADFNMTWATLHHFTEMPIWVNLAAVVGSAFAVKWLQYRDEERKMQITPTVTDVAPPPALPGSSS